ncbi:MAG: hypothetical protein A2087_14875 [Spirochaetes bacterium GWD1_61_31]|nr:MAG: hypothetical protein A2Y37_09825 [Spirochaetes bacterium GWB1_60_80]OHD31706.1 MAG: hypothetical protein A2004_03370 [Spirochaetes bacterium GWC1_61_12]OHD36249.1 MAG: hypothetical protein A2087_14875 [Spirochaetes bacterium GWD1_61_31]OHD41504.1 MAG: hypothetical protein A2Y35_06130 [Spirochaetes bacterium GWE1_60_18]OHD61406.1 MAG: hypothetical protein A2Y32_04520 [Spirochaetes bacterium GWF1_60_12]HAP44537.1 hypothetical protein [Spirochaetaceae bacterium]
MKPAIQPGLFEDFPEETEGRLGSMVRIEPSSDQDLSPLQKKFNNLARKIESLRAKIVEKEKVYSEILQYWGKKLASTHTIIADKQTALAFAIEKKTRGFKLGSRQRATVGETILALLRDAFDKSPPEKEAQDLFTRWNNTSFDEELKRQEAEITEAFTDTFREMFGVDIDEEAFAEGPDALHDAIWLTIGEIQSNEGQGQRKRSKKQLEKEERERLAAEFEKKSVKSLYISLVKVLHPDAEMDATAKIKKEQTMKELTVAYEAGDLHTLLRIEREWIEREVSATRLLPDEKLKAYISALREQAHDLEEEYYAIDYSPQYMQIEEYLSLNAPWVKQRIDKDAQLERRRAALMDELLDAFSIVNEKQAFLAIIRDLQGE